MEWVKAKLTWNELGVTKEKADELFNQYHKKFLLLNN
jgi:hypothetical protein